MKILIILTCALAIFPADLLCATPLVSFMSREITVKQTAGAVNIPIQTTGNLNPDPELYPEVKLNTQRATAVSGREYEGISDYYLDFHKPNSILHVTIPIYYTGSTQDKKFNVILSNASDCDISPINVVTVTILGVKLPPKMEILTTKGIADTRFTIYGAVLNVKSTDIKSVAVTLAGKPLYIRGKMNWNAPNVKVTNPGAYKVVAKAVLTSGKTVSKSQYLYIYN